MKEGIIMAKRWLSWILMLAMLLPFTPRARAVSARSRIVVERGIDVSEYQGNIDWDTLAKHVDFVIIRCGFGQNRVEQDDEKWLRNVEACTRLGIPFGVYLYSYATTEEAARSEAEHVLRLIKGYNLALPVYIDVEDKYIENHCTDRQILKHVTIFCDIISEAGYTPGVYSNASWWEDHMDYDEYDKWERWVAQWNKDLNFDRPYSMWQYSNTGRIPGIQGNVDLDYWFGRKLTDECAHIYSSETVKLPTCKEEGIAKHTCTLCGNSYETSMPLSDHNYIETDSGTEGVVKFVCSVCGHSYEQNTQTHQHTFTETVKQPTCTEDGFIKHSCTTCDYSYEERVPSTGHSYTKTVVPPSTTHGGYTVFSCYCGYSYAGETQPCLNHIANNGHIAKPPTETERGERAYFCVSCNEYLRREVLPSASEHRAQCPSAVFADMPSYMHWAHEGIDHAIQNGLFKGVGGNRFDPDGTMTRAMLVTVLWRLEKCPVASRPSGFTDVWQGDWYAEAVAWAQERGLINGLGDGRFDPTGVITREQFASVLYRYFAGTWAQEGDLSDFPDAATVSDYAKDPVSWAVYRGYIAGTIIGGYTILDPQGAVTRAQAATILHRLPLN